MTDLLLLPREVERRSQALWPFRPRPAPDELLSSFLFRLAQGHGVRPIVFLNSILGSRKNLMAQDLDNFAPANLVARLSRGCGLSEAEIEACTIGGPVAAMNLNHNKRGRNAWTLPMTVDNNSRHRPGLQFCPICLVDDRPIYVRRWRLAFVTTCSRHGILLRDRCPHCAAPVHLHEMESLADCYRCGQDIRRTTQPAAPAILQWQRRAEAAIDAGWARLGGEFVHSAVWFAVARQIAALLVNGKRAPDFRSEAARLFGGDPGEFPKPTRRQPFEYLEVGDRHRLLGMVAALMEGWPHRFVQAAWDAGIRRSHAIKDMAHVPFVFDAVLRDYLDAAPYQASDAEVAAAAAWLRRTRGAARYRDLKAICGESRKAIYRHMDYERKQSRPSRWLARAGL